VIPNVDARLVYDLAHPLDPAMPVSPNHPGYRMALLRRHGDVVRADGGSAANEMIVMGGHTGTHLDGLAHVSHNGKLHGGVDANVAQTGGRFSSLGMESVAPIVCRGVILDVAGACSSETLGAGAAVSAADLERVAAAQKTEVRGAGAILVRTGWSRKWGDPEAYLGHNTGVPGIDVSGARWIASQSPRVAGGDTMAFEQIAPGQGHALLPVHGVLLVECGIHILENLDLERLAADKRYEFLFLCLPLPFVGATGSPVRPVAVAFP
jgi:kynurenine formamidase